ncbi:MAG: hypothetical protein ACXVCV_13735 [Polyangia bacterium]
MCAALAASTAARADEFWKYWADGKAELDGYALVEPRYGQPRDGTAVLIFVTEDFSDALRVKADPGKHDKADVAPVLKLNLVRDFQTGIYDYNTMTSTFLRTEPDGGGAPFALAKTSFSSQEWCGHVYMQWLPRGTRLVGTSHSYFDGEADATPELELPPGGVVEDALPILVRGLRGDWLAPGATRKVPFLRSQLRTRLLHVPAKWGEATISRAPASAEVKSALGALRAYSYTVAETGGDTITFTVEEAAPHRLLAWKSSSGESARILGSARLPYWTMHDNGGEKALKLLGLVPQALPPKK